MIRKIGLFLSEEPSGGGKFQYSLSLIDAFAALPSQSYEITACYRNRLWSEYLADKGVASVHVPFNLLDRLLTRVWATPYFPPRLIRRISPHIHSAARKMVSLQADLWVFPNHEHFTYQIPVRALAAIHDLMHRYEPRFPEVSASGLYAQREWALRNICQRAKAVLVDSQIGKKQVIDSYAVPPEKIFVLPYIAPHYIYDKPAQANFSHKYNIPSKYIFYPAQFWQHKNHEGLIKALISLKDEIPDLCFIFVGSEKNHYRYLRELVNRSELTKNVLFLDYVPNRDMPEFYRRARAMVMPTFFGPTNIPPLEAIALGCPVATSDIYGMREQLGDAAIYFDPSSTPEIASAVARLWSDDALCSALSKRGLARSAHWGQNQFNHALRNIIETVTQSAAVHRS
ncbi:MAG: glycosyltransferase family 4 protein [Syntrophales bacterium]